MCVCPVCVDLGNYILEMFVCVCPRVGLGELHPVRCHVGSADNTIAADTMMQPPRHFLYTFAKYPYKQSFDKVSFVFSEVSHPSATFESVFTSGARSPTASAEAQLARRASSEFP